MGEEGYCSYGSQEGDFEAAEVGCRAEIVRGGARLKAFCPSADDRKQKGAALSRADVGGLLFDNTERGLVRKIQKYEENRQRKAKGTSERTCTTPSTIGLRRSHRLRQVRGSWTV